jgi:hypothetical protein
MALSSRLNGFGQPQDNVSVVSITPEYRVLPLRQSIRAGLRLECDTGA